MLQDQPKVNRELKRLGFGALNDPSLMQQMGFCIRDHNHFRSILAVMTPEERQKAYPQLRAHLQFEAKPLDVYISELQQKAEREKLPIANSKNLDVIEFEDYHNKPVPLEVLAERAILASHRDENKKGVLVVTCRKCTREQAYPGRSKKESLHDAAADGWQNERIAGRVEITSLCPGCAPKLVLTD